MHPCASHSPSGFPRRRATYGWRSGIALSVRRLFSPTRLFGSGFRATTFLASVTRAAALSLSAFVQTASDDAELLAGDLEQDLAE